MQSSRHNSSEILEKMPAAWKLASCSINYYCLCVFHCYNNIHMVHLAKCCDTLSLKHLTVLSLPIAGVTLESC
jgi:hypothetical protein